MKKPLYDDKLIVITGALGFIGSCLVKYLNDKGFYNLLLVDDFDHTHKWKNISGKKFVDIISIQEMFPFLEGRERDIEAIIHLGACSDTTEMDGSFLYDNNYRFSVKLCEYALEHGHRFIIASSAATYGLGEHGFKDDEEGLDRLRPLNPYALSKHLFDLWAKRQNLLKDIVSLKYFNIFGPNEAHKGHMASMIYKMVPKIITEGSIQLFKSTDPKYPDGGQIRDFLYVKDAVAMTASFLENDLHGIFNIGSGQATTWNRLSEMLFETLHKPINIQYIDMPESMKAAYQNYTLADMQKFRTQTRYVPKFTLETSVQDYLTNHLLCDRGF
jgi:ADP-L-glycero-D-manno-heptose 6-epimerase